MKKYCLYILVCGFLLSLAYPGNVFYKDVQEQSSVSVNHQSKHPSTEFEINGNTGVNAGHSSRIQGGLAFLTHADAGAASGHYLFAINFTGNNNLSFKQYLAHIYPSHNYW